MNDSQPSRSQEDERPPAILVVDDEQANRRIASMLLGKMGLQVDCVDSMDAALHRVEHTQYTAMLLDLSLQEGNGDYLAVKIRELLGPQTPPLFAWTATPSPEIEQRCLHAGMSYVLTKPLNKALFTAVMQRFANIDHNYLACDLPGNTMQQHSITHLSRDLTDEVIDHQLIEQHLKERDEHGLLLPQLVAILRHEGVEQERQCRSALATNSPTLLRKSCHRLAGCAATVGASRLAHYARMLEVAVREGRPVSTHHIDRMVDLCREALTALDDYLHNQPTKTPSERDSTTLESTRLADSSTPLDILLVEDSPAEQLIFSSSLRRCLPSIIIHEATSLDTALEQLGRQAIHVIILDLSLPDSDGVETFLAVHRRAPQTPIVILSGSDDENLIVNLVQQGAEDFLVKNVVREGQLWRAVQLALARQRNNGQQGTRLSPDAPLLPVGEGQRLEKSSASGLRLDLHENMSLGSGGMADVFVADQFGLNRQVAVKVLRRNRASLRAQELFQTEARILAQLEHPHIVPVYDMGESFIVMQRIQGQTLAESLRDDGDRQRMHKHIAVLADICDAVSYAHSKGIIHRDIKPENIMYGEHRSSFLLDWGLALTVIPPAPSVEPIAPLMPNSRAQLCAGTPAYLPPEIANADPQLIGFATDVFLLGGTLYAILAHRPLYKNMVTKDMLTVASCAFFQPLEEVAPKTPSVLRNLVTTATSVAPGDRPPLCVFAATLRQWLGHNQHY